MYSDDDIQYAMETTRVIHEPDRLIDTFGSTAFNFTLVSELMDRVGEVRIREGRLEADKPAILSPEHLADLNFEGFGDAASDFGDWLQRNSADLAFLKYGFNFKRTDVKESIVHDPIDEVLGRVVDTAKDDDDPLQAVIYGVDDTWEICLLRFSIEMMQRSHGVNVFDFKRRGLL